MNLFAGLSRTDYQDLFRAIGAIIDTQGLRDVRLWEHAQGIVLQGQRPAKMGEEPRYDTILLTDAELEQLLAEAYQRRAAGRPPGE